MGRGNVFESLGFDYPRTIFNSVPVEELEQQNGEIEMPKDCFQHFMEHTDVVKCGRGRAAPLSEVSNFSAGDISISPRNVGEFDKFELFRDANTVPAYHVLIGYVPTPH